MPEYGLPKHLVDGARLVLEAMLRDAQSDAPSSDRYKLRVITDALALLDMYEKEHPEQPVHTPLDRRTLELFNALGGRGRHEFQRAGFDGSDGAWGNHQPVKDRHYSSD